MAADYLKGKSPFVIIDNVFELYYLENSGGLRVPSRCCAATKLKGSSASDFERLRKSYKRIQTDKL